MPPTQSLQLCGLDEIVQALDQGTEIALILVQKGLLGDREQALVARARTLGIRIREESANDLRRLSNGESPATLLGLRGVRPSATLESVMSASGVVWLLSGVTYPSNTGSILRTVEVTGADAIVIDAPFNRSGRTRTLRVSIRADRFMPVVWATSMAAIGQAKAVQRRVIAVEDSGTRTPWETELTGPLLLVVGGERDGIAAEVLEQCDDVVRLPMPGFIPSYGVQAAVAAVATERLRQLALAFT